MKTTGPRRRRRPPRAAARPAETPRTTGATKSSLTRPTRAARPATSRTTDKAAAESLFSPTLPSSYGGSRLVLMDVDPFKVFAYWELLPEDQRVATRRLGRAAASATWVLRFHDVTSALSDGSTEDTWFDVDVDLAPGNWYVNLWAADKRYWVELGPRASNGRFVPVCRSNLVQTPPGDVSARYEPVMLRVEGNFDTVEPAEYPAAIDALPESPASPLNLTAEPPVDAEAPGEGKPLRAGEPVAEREPSMETKPSTEDVAASVAAAVDAPERPHAFVSNDASLQQRFDALAGTAREGGDIQMAVIPPATMPTPGVSPVGEPVARRHPDAPFTRSTTGPGQDGAPARSASDEPVPSVTLSAEASATVSSLVTGGPLESALALTLSVEVVISGRAQPGQTVEVNGQQLDVGPEGAFSVRLALPVKQSIE
jgi:hypothetical protein